MVVITKSRCYLFASYLSFLWALIWHWIWELSSPSQGCWSQLCRLFTEQNSRQRGQWRLKASLCCACQSLLAGAGSGAPREGSISNPHKGALPAGIAVPRANTLSLLLRPPLPFTPGGRGREWSVCKSPQYKVVWGHWPDSHLLSSPSLDSSSVSPSCLFQSLLHRRHSLRKSRLRLKEENYSLHDTCASSVKSRTDEREPAEFSSLPPPLNPSLKLREKLWKRAAHKQCLSNSHRTETKGDHCLLPQMWGESAWLASRSHTCCKSFSQNWPQGDSSLIPSPLP